MCITIISQLKNLHSTQFVSSWFFSIFAAIACCIFPSLAWAAEGIDGAHISSLWGIPFAALLLSIALGPIFAPKFWHHHFGKITAVWGMVFLVPFAIVFGPWLALGVSVHALIAEYIPFVILLSALYVISGGIHIRGSLRGTPILNTSILAIGAALASFMGTTGASMLLIRPLIRANIDRKYQTHIVVFFIFIVSNIGGSLTPLGDPPLFLGFLKGVEFSWTFYHLWQQMLFLVIILLAIFFLVDTYLYQREEKHGLPKKTIQAAHIPLAFEGKWNFVLLAAAIGFVLMSGLWRTHAGWDIMGTHLGAPAAVRDLGLLLLLLLSLKITPKDIYASNQFSWEPIKEVAKLFAGIFLTIIPVIAMLQAGAHGPFAPLIAAVTLPDGEPEPAMYFWVTGILSSFLDNAPTYLVFFNTAGGDAQALMTGLAPTLTAISAGAVFMGANSYIGNAPNLMVKAIAEDRGVKMPSFFGYLLWSFGILMPLFLALSWIFYRVT